MGVFLSLGYLLVGLIQFFALWDGLNYALGLPSIFGFILSLFLTYIPVIGTILGIYGAVKVWDWDLLRASLLFFWYVPVMLVVLLIGGIGSFFERKA